MNIILYLLIIGVCLSIDAFSVSLNLGWQLNRESWYLLFSLIVGLFHFVMPILGAFLGTRIRPFLFLETNVTMGIILLFIGLVTLINLYHDEEVSFISNISLVSLAFGVSLDSFTIGIGLFIEHINIILAGFIFTLCSFSLTYIGLILSKYLSTKFEKKFKKLSVFLLLLLGVIHILK